MILAWASPFNIICGKAKGGGADLRLVLGQLRRPAMKAGHAVRHDNLHVTYLL